MIKPYLYNKNILGALGADQKLVSRTSAGIPNQQRQSNRKYGTWDKISTRSMNKNNSNNVKINTITKNEQQNRKEGIDGKDVKSLVLKNNKNLKQLKPTYDKV